MPQIFHRRTNTLARLTIVGAVGVVAFLGWALLALTRSGYNTYQGLAREQPLPFSHRHHAGELGIDCRYCHTAVEYSSSAGIPPTKTCMNCHAQIWADSPTLEPVRASFRTDESIKWVRVHDLPDFVYFNHSIHVQKGIGCVSCHGRVDRMNLTWQENSLQMEWCLDCHRQPERFLRPREQVFNMEWVPPGGDQVALGRQLIKDYQIPVERLIDCSTCHR